MLRRGLLQAQPQEAAQRERVGRAPRDPALRIDPFAVADQQQPELRARQQAGATHRCRMELRALRLDERVKRVPLENRIETLVKRVPAGHRQLVGGDPQSRRPRAIPKSTHGHVAV